MRVVRSARGSAFVLCERSRRDARYARYPALPVLRCEGHAPVPLDDASERPEAR